MARITRIPRFVRTANLLTTTLLRAGFKLVGFGVPMYLLTVRGRKSGQPRTTPVSIVEYDGKRYVFAPYGAVDWVRNLRAAGTATITRGRRAEEIRAVELPSGDAGVVLRRFIESGNPIGRFFGLTPASPQEEFERATLTRPVFQLYDVAEAGARCGARLAHMFRSMGLSFKGARKY